MALCTSGLLRLTLRDCGRQLSTNTNLGAYRVQIGKYMLGPPEELWVLSSANLLTEKDASMISWTLLPDADHGISLPQDQFEKYNFEEAHVVPMNGVGAPGFYIEGEGDIF